jgi:hypothetical protein
MVGESMGRSGVRITPVPRIDMNGEAVAFSNELEDAESNIKNCYHVRLKSGDRDQDSEKFYILNEYDNFMEYYKANSRT